MKVVDPLGLAGRVIEIKVEEGYVIPENKPWEQAYNPSKLPSLKKQGGFNSRA